MVSHDLPRFISQPPLSICRSPDYESVKSFSIDAQSTDACPYGPRSRSVRVDISILDVNDNVPVFSQLVYSADVSADFPVGDVVVKVTASDSDSSVNAHLSYTLLDANQYFQVS